MKIVTNDYGCGTSSSILDYEIQDAVVVSQDNWRHIAEIKEDLFFIGHDFLLYMWDTDEKIDLWRKHPGKRLVWCFEPIDSPIKQWHAKSHYSMSQCQKFMHDAYGADERTCDKYGIKWMPQWCSSRFYSLKDRKIESDKILFSGQAGKPEYEKRNSLLSLILQDKDLSNKIEITNTSRSLGWDDYIDNFLKYPVILNPMGILHGCNTRAYETIISGRVLLQQEDSEGYRRHRELLQRHPNVFFYKTYEELKEIILDTNLIDLVQEKTDNQYSENNIYSRFSDIGIKIN